MQTIVVFIVIAAAIAGFYYFGQLPEEKGEILQPQKSLGQIAAEKPEEPEAKIEAAEEESPILIDTYLRFGPRDGAIIDDTNKVIFGFGARVLPEETKGRIYFETKVEGLEDDWKETSATKRTITLTPGPKEYTFLVRAKIKGIVDPTPIKRNFKIEISPHFAKVKIYRVNPPAPLKTSLITLRTDLKGGEEVNITGWEIEGKQGSFIIPRGVKVYDQVNSPFFSEDIVVERGDKIYISSEANPLGEDSGFRPNKCFGHLTKSHSFPIPVSKSCPRIERERLSYLSPFCQKYVLEMDSCGALVSEKLNEYNLYGDSECLSFIMDNFGYSSCLIDYSGDKDFLKKEWHIYLDRTEREIMDEKKDTIYLRDKDGLLIDKYSYGMPRL